MDAPFSSNVTVANGPRPDYARSCPGGAVSSQLVEKVRDGSADGEPEWLFPEIPGLGRIVKSVYTQRRKCRLTVKLASLRTGALPKYGCKCNSQIDLMVCAFGRWRAFSHSNTEWSLYMADVVRSATQEFWHSPAEESARLQPSPAGFATACPECGAEFLPGAAFCHACGETRSVEFSSGWLGRFEIGSLEGMFGLTLAPLVAFFLGLACAAAAVLAGVFSNPQTVLDWQVVQAWRIEWLVASVASFVAGILLKRPSAR